jgi:hypothetical protein
MNPIVRNSLNAIRAPEDALINTYDLGFYTIGYERRSRFLASKLIGKTKCLCGLEYATGALAMDENRRWAAEAGVHITRLNEYRIDKDRSLHRFVHGVFSEYACSEHEKHIFVDVSSMDRSLMARLLHSIFAIAPAALQSSPLLCARGFP